MITAIWKEERGSVAIFFAGVFVVILGFIGAAIDFSSAYRIQSNIQNAADSTALAAANSGDISQSAIDRLSQEYFAGVSDNIVASVTGELVGDQVVVKASQSVPTRFLRAVGFESVDVTAEAVALVPVVQDSEIALVLDYSGSMNREGKYQAMRDSAKNLVETLLSASTSARSDLQPDVQIGLVPFSDFVYMDVLSTYVREVHPDKYGQTVRACLDSRRYPAAINDTTPNQNQQDTKWSAPGMPNEWRNAGGFASTGINTLDTGSAYCSVSQSQAECEAEATALGLTNGGGDDDDDDEDGGSNAFDDYVAACVTGGQQITQSNQCQKSYSGAEILTQNNEALASDFATASAACQAYSDRNLMVQPLTSNATLLQSKLDAMTPIRLTNIALGLEMGWHMLTRNAPLTEAVSYGDEDMLKFLVLLTDGRQTVGGWGPGGSYNVNRAENNTEALCENIKDEDIRVLTIAFDIDDSQTRNRLRDCATSTADYFEPETNEELAAVFETIKAKLVQTSRLVK